MSPHLTLRLLYEMLTAGEGCSEVDSFHLVKIIEFPSSPCSHELWNGIFLTIWSCFLLALERMLSRPKKALKDSCKAFIMNGYPQPELGEGGAVTITPEGRAANKSQPLPGRGDKRVERWRFGTQVGQYLQPPNIKPSRNIITNTCASLKTQTVFFLHRLTAHTELIISSQVFLQQEENR